MIGPFVAAVSLKVSLIIPKAIFDVSADWINWGKKIIFFSYCLPTVSKAGMRILLIISKPGVVFNNSFVALVTSSFKPWRTISFKVNVEVSFFVMVSWLARRSIYTAASWS